jgi:hypothetical protein
MAITKETIERYLKEIGVINKRTDENADYIIYTFAFGDEDHTLRILIKLEEKTSDGSDGYEFIQMRLFDLVDDSKFKSRFEEKESTFALAKFMLREQNYLKKLGRWSFDTDDGDHYIGINIPIEDGTLTFKQFARIFGALYSGAQNTQDDLRKLLGMPPLVLQTEAM